jgi:hypothetical protein
MKMFRAGNVILNLILTVNNNSLNGKTWFVRVAITTFILNSLKKMGRMIANVAIQTTVGKLKNSITTPPGLNWMGNTMVWLVLNATNQTILH